ncbi:lysophospholipid acyltransferase family protein [Actinomyces sp. zg296]|uniref:lysophospholipid acyltransferase family protein n=1 Tax=Actinomyces sp. zg296 TaxID=2609289 RepID=UPI001F2DF184|nr:lysophospholipid acyltransferase family protein [Actinomyces sp. zg296]
MSLFYRFASRGAIIPFLKIVSRQRVTGVERFPADGGFIAVANHLSNIDALTAMRTLVDADIPAYSLAKASLFKIPVVGQVLRAGGQIPVQRGTASASDALREAERVLADGGVIMIFPEGTLSRDPLKWPMVGKTGAARLAMSTGVPVIPMAQWGGQDIMDTCTDAFHPFPPKPVTVRVGEPLDLTRFGSDTDDHDAVRACTAEIMRAITAELEVIRGEKAPRPFDPRYDIDHGPGAYGERRPDPDPGAAPGVAARPEPGAGDAPGGRVESEEAGR